VAHVQRIPDPSIRFKLARDAIMLAAQWEQSGTRDNAPVVIGTLSAALELLLEVAEQMAEHGAEDGALPLRQLG